MIEALAVVPPMSKVRTFESPMRRARAREPTTPAAGPDSMMCIGIRAAASALIRPPLDCMIKSGARVPISARPARSVAR